jgi:hypothetical protein
VAVVQVDSAHHLLMLPQEQQEQQTLVVAVVELLMDQLAELVALVLSLFVGRNCADKYSINLRVLNV